METLGARHNGAVSNRISGLMEALFASAVDAKTKTEKQNFYFAISLLIKDSKKGLL